jgi:uncharacterized protein (TIGR03083 family)
LHRHGIVGAVQLTPFYGSDPILVLDGSPSAIAEPTIRQRRRLAGLLTELSEEQWAHPSRCEGWSAQDVIIHQDSTNTFWLYSISAGLRGEPTEFLAAFDPKASPAELVADSQEIATEEVLARFLVSNEALLSVLEGLGDDDWSILAEAPPGHVSISAVTHHALWDCWVHERDILLPLGEQPVVEPDEVAACLRYAAALTPALAMSHGADGRGVLAIDVTDPDVAVTVEVDGHISVRDGIAGSDVTLAGDAVDVLEMLSIRRPFEHEVPEDLAWMLTGIVETFESTEP